MAKQTKRPAMIINVDGEEREISFEELTLSNNITLEAIVRILARKGIMNSEEFIKELESLQKERMSGT